MAIVSVKDERVQALLERRVPGKGFPASLARAAQRKVLQLNEATALDQLREPPGNRLEALKGDRAGQHSIRVNQQFRLCFFWTGTALLRWSWWTTIEETRHERR